MKKSDSNEVKEETKEKNLEKTSNVNCKSKYEASSKKMNILAILIASIAITAIFVRSFIECKSCKYELTKKTYRAFDRNNVVASGYLNNVLTVLDRLGYVNNSNGKDWDLLWAHQYPFVVLSKELKNLKPHQKVNHFPGCGHITNKVDLAISGLKYIPKAFKLPNDKIKLLDYVKNNGNKIFVQKNNNHRDIKIKNVTEIDLDTVGTFIQEFVTKPLLISGHKFDIGIYTIITSIDPLRAYIYNGDLALRFCPLKYYPFDSNVVGKYVIAADYLPAWEVPDIEYYINTLKLGYKQSLNLYLLSIGKDPNIIWNQIEESIRIVLLENEPKLIAAAKNFKSNKNFFEMMRFDFIVDEDLTVYLLEANMSPNLSSSHHSINQNYYDQILYNLLSLVGVGERINRNSLATRSENEESMISTDKNIAIFSKECNTTLCRNNCDVSYCHLCLHCLSSETKKSLLKAYREHINKGDCKRIFPPQMLNSINNYNLPENFVNFSKENQLQYKWFLGKCMLDPSWCL